MLLVLALCFSLHTGHQKAPFLLQLQKASYESLASTPFGIAVVDWEDARLTKSEIQRIKQQGKTLVTYLSIGEAETYRDYWKKSWNTHPPVFLEKENPQWPGNYKVKYWQDEWQQIILDKLRKIIALGYDGVYLDIVDAYWYFEEKGNDSARQAMINFIIRLSKTAKALNPEFLIIPQNAPELITDLAYLAAIDGLGKEDTWYNDDIPLVGKNHDYELHYLRDAIKAGKFVLATDYMEDPALQEDFITQAAKEGFIPFVGTRALDKSNINPAINCVE